MEIVPNAIPPMDPKERREWRQPTQFRIAQAANNAANDLAQGALDGRYGEKRRERAFYLKPKVRRNRHMWRGVLRQRRRDFNYRLRWALKSMTRCGAIATATCTRQLRRLLQQLGWVLWLAPGAPGRALPRW
jgi:hypothetical protein